jgi:hypothetical protein
MPAGVKAAGVQKSSRPCENASVISMADAELRVAAYLAFLGQEDAFGGRMSPGSSPFGR